MIFLADFRAWGHLRYLTPFHNDVLLVDGKQNHFYIESLIARQRETQGKVQAVPGGGGDSAYKRSGDARRKFWIKPLKDNDLGVAQAFFEP